MVYNWTSYALKFDRVILIGLAALVPLLMYLSTLAPDVTWGHQGADGGDLMTAAYTLGVPHPSGYPTYVLVGWFFSRLPIGSIGWRFNLLSAVSVAGGSAVICQLIWAATRSQLAGLVAAWTMATMPLIWSQAIITEVYSLNLFYVAWLLWLAWRMQAGETGVTFWLGMIFGLALGVHLTNLFLLPLLLGPVIFSGRVIWFRLVAGMSCGVLIFLYLPLRANAGAITWGEPATLSGFWDLISGQIYRGYVFDLPYQSLGPRLLALVGYLAESGPVTLILAGIGTWEAWQGMRRRLVWSTVTVGVYIIYAITYRTADSYVFLLPVFVLIAVATGLGVAVVISKAQSRPARWSLTAIILASFIVGSLISGARLNLRDDTVASQFWQTVMAQAPDNAILLTYEDRHTFTLWYAQHVLGQRSDVAVVDTGLLAYGWYRRNLKQNYPWLIDAEQLPTRFAQRQAVARPLCVVLTRTSSEIEQVARWDVDCLKDQAD